MTNTYSSSHGCGDFFQCESFMTEAERDSIKTIYYATNNAQSNALRETIEACPRYAHVEHKYLAYPTERLPGVQSIMADHGILHRKKFTGSSFLACQLADLPFELPERFDFLHLSTPMNFAVSRETRDMKPSEWSAVLKRLEDRNTVGVVLNNLVEGELPESDRLIDLRGQTTLPQAIEILKKANGYLGIDSCFAILAAQLFDHDDLLIRTQNPYVVQECWSYYSPHEDIGFLTPEIGKPRYSRMSRPQRQEGVLVELKCNHLVGIRSFGLDERVELTPERAEELIRLGKAIPYELNQEG